MLRRCPVPTDQEGPPPTGRGLRRPPVWSVVVSAAAVVGALGYGVHQLRAPASPSSIRPSGIPADVPTALASLMGLSPDRTRPAPDFTLVDQNGRSVSLSSLRGRPVVLEFMDPHCTDICPIISQEFTRAYADLRGSRPDVAFVAVNVNQYHNTTADMLAYTQEHGLSAIPTWHFVTGPVPALRSVWWNYGIYVDAQSPDADVVHSSVVFFLDSHGMERYSASPTDYHTSAGDAYLPAGQIEQWGQGIALVAKSLS